MLTILIVEDDDDIRNNMARLLKLEGFSVVSAINGRQALERSAVMKPDLVISDVNMPEMGGLELLAAIRADRVLAPVPVMLLTALDDRASMRRGMAAGADDYLTKPFTRAELLEAVQGLLGKKARFDQAVQSELAQRETSLRQAFIDSLGGEGGTAVTRFGLELTPPAGVVADQVIEATVLFSDIRNFTAIAERLTSAEVAELLTEYFSRTSDAVLRYGGRFLRFVGDGLMVLFSEGSSESPLSPARRGVSAALAMVLATNEFRAWLDRRFVGRGLPPFAIGVGLHAGEVTICQLGTVQHKESTPIGDTVNSAARLEGASKELGWTVVASTEVLDQAGHGVQTGQRAALTVRGKNVTLDAAEVVGLVTDIEDMRHGIASLTERAAAVRAAVKSNSEITARAFKDALESKLSALKEHSFTHGQQPLRLKGYEVIRKIGSGGMTDVYLARREEDELAIVLKVLNARGEGAAEQLARFIQEYTLLSQVGHPNVIRIYDQGFTDDHAYIAMEYFERGDLRSQMDGAMPRGRVLEVITQLASALVAIHDRGIVHRDVKPENLMLRDDGSVALADFGIAKQWAANAGLSDTRHGDLVGTPFYLSPEQAGGKRIAPQSDFYSLGVMMFEMLAGQRPFRGDSLNELLACHLHAPTPALPPQHADLQPLVERLMAKDPAARPADARELLRELQALA